MSKIIINGKVISSSSNSVIITNNNGKVFFNGSEITTDSKDINIIIEGNVEDVSVDCCSKLTISGNAKTVHTQSGDVDISGNVEGGVQTMSGSVDCGNIGGSVSTMSGSIKHKNNNG